LTIFADEFASIAGVETAKRHFTKPFGTFRDQNPIFRDIRGAFLPL
jgi:hypothetical protein